MCSARDFGAREVSLAEAARRWSELFAEDLGAPLSWVDRP